jgi:hypothetical protein
MTGRYLIHTPVESARDEKRFDKAWRRFAEVCRSLHRDGLSYEVQLHLAGDNPHVLIYRKRDGQISQAIGRAPCDPAAPSACATLARTSARALSGQREHFKPGRTDETASAVDEVAA